MRLGHHQDVDGSVWLVLVVNPLIAILVALAAAFLTRRSWARGLTLVNARPLAEHRHSDPERRTGPFGG